MRTPGAEIKFNESHEEDDIDSQISKMSSSMPTASSVMVMISPLVTHDEMEVFPNR